MARAVEDTLHKGYFPLVLSGDHSSALGTMAGLKRAYPTQKIGVIWIDAHADLHSPYSTPSGNIHGMPLAAALANDNRTDQRNLVEGQILKDWDELKSLGGVKCQF